MATSAARWRSGCARCLSCPATAPRPPSRCATWPWTTRPRTRACAPSPARVDDVTRPGTALSYGAHKLAMEILLADYTRRGFLRARAVRLPGIVPRPPAPNGAWSAFSSTLIRALAAGEPCTLPVGPRATLWLMSRRRCIDNLLHAAWLATQPAGDRTAWTLPALHVSVQEIVEAFEARGDGQAGARVRHAPEPATEAPFGSQPPP